MTLAAAALLVALAVLTLWGVFSPRGQWRTLAGWTRRDSYADEPGPVLVGIHRVVAIVATVALGVASFTLYQEHQDSLPKPPAAVPLLQQMWGAPDPVVLNRVFSNQTTAPTDLVETPVLRYEKIDGPHRSPAYLFDLKDWARPGQKAWAGILGKDPSVGLTALDDANLIVQVRGDSRCVPRAVTTVEGANTVAVGVFYGRPDGSATLNDCKPITSDSASVSLLIPILLTTNLGSRSVTSLSGTAIDSVKDLIG